ncbi:MAG: hypothetical protein V4480_04180 [Patescibacteria group bacterium]
MKTPIINKKYNIYGALGALAFFFLISGIAFAGHKIALSPFDSKDIYTSPDGKFRAVTVQKDEETIETYITDENGRTIVKPHAGSFVSWSPNSSKTLVFLSDIQNPKGREVYILGIDGSYENSGLPIGTISAAYSTVNSDIAYSRTEKGTDNSNLYVRDVKGEDQLILKGDNNILTWLSWSPQGNKILFMQSDLLIRPGKQSLWIMDADGSNKEKITSVDWDYPAVWSPDSTRIAFANAGDIWEYRTQDRTLIRLTNQEMYKSAIHPEYSPDGKTITYIAKSRYTEDRISIDSSQPQDINDPISDPITPVSVVASSTLDNNVSSPEATTSSSIESQSIN